MCVGLFTEHTDTTLILNRGFGSDTLILGRNNNPDINNSVNFYGYYSRFLYEASFESFLFSAFF